MIFSIQIHAFINMLNTRVYLAFRGREMRKHFHNIFFLYLVLELNNYAKNQHNVSTYVHTTYIHM